LEEVLTHTFFSCRSWLEDFLHLNIEGYGHPEGRSRFVDIVYLSFGAQGF